MMCGCVFLRARMNDVIISQAMYHYRATALLGIWAGDYKYSSGTFGAGENALNNLPIEMQHSVPTYLSNTVSPFPGLAPSFLGSLPSAVHITAWKARLQPQRMLTEPTYSHNISRRLWLGSTFSLIRWSPVYCNKNTDTFQLTFDLHNYRSRTRTQLAAAAIWLGPRIYRELTSLT